MKAIGLVFLYERKQGEPSQISKLISDHFPNITQNLVNEGLIGLPESKEIMENKYIYWGGIKEDFNGFLEDEKKIGGIAIELFENYSGLKVSDDVESLIYDGTQTPWGFTLVVCVLYS